MADTEKLKTRLDTVLDDPGAEAVARVYAESLLDVLPQDQAEPVLAELRSFVHDLLASQPQFAHILMSPMVNRDDKLGIIDRVLHGRASDFLANFLRVLARHDRLDLLPVILRQTELQHERRGGKQRVQVTSATPLSQQQLASIREGIKTRVTFEPLLETAVDPALLGGVRIRIGDTVYDSSLRTRLKHLHHQMRRRGIHEIQSGRDRFSHP